MHMFVIFYMPTSISVYRILIYFACISLIIYVCMHVKNVHILVYSLIYIVVYATAAMILNNLTKLQSFIVCINVCMYVFRYTIR